MSETQTMYMGEDSQGRPHYMVGVPISHDFAWALKQMHDGKKVYRSVWDFKHTYVYVAKSKYGVRWFEKVTWNCDSSKWEPDINDMYAHDWVLYEEPKDGLDCDPVPTTNLTFGEALEWLKKGKRVTRDGWNGKGQWIEKYPGGWVTLSDGKELMHRAGFFLKTVTNELVDWVPSVSDILDEDWCVVE